MRELRHRLRDYLARVERGEAFEVTVFGRAVARLAPLPPPRSTFEQLVAAGKVTRALRSDTAVLPAAVPATTGISATGALMDERRADAR